MPAKPSYCHRLQQGVSALEMLKTSWVDRRQVEEALGVSKTVAWRILRMCGAEAGPGKALVCQRDDLISRLKSLETGGGVHQREIARRERLGQLLDKVRPAVIANLTTVARDEQALNLISSTFRNLPEKILLTPESLHIEFSGTGEFLRLFGAVVYALNNDYEEISRFLGT